MNQERKEELAAKIDYEGGLYEYLFGYGGGLQDTPFEDELLELCKKVESFEKRFHKWMGDAAL